MLAAADTDFDGIISRSEDTALEANSMTTEAPNLDEGGLRPDAVVGLIVGILLVCVLVLVVVVLLLRKRKGGGPAGGKQRLGAATTNPTFSPPGMGNFVVAEQNRGAGLQEVECVPHCSVPGLIYRSFVPVVPTLSALVLQAVHRSPTTDCRHCPHRPLGTTVLRCERVTRIPRI